MSFSLDIKSEVINIINNIHCAIAEFSAFVNYISKIKFENEQMYLIFSSENENLINKCHLLIKYIFSKDFKIENQKNKHFEIIIKDINFINTIFSTINQEKYKKDIFSNLITKNICCKRAYIRGAFICIGYIANPNKNYHLEFANLSLSQAEA